MGEILVCAWIVFCAWIVYGLATIVMWEPWVLLKRSNKS